MTTDKEKVIETLKAMQDYIKMNGEEFKESYCKPQGIPVVAMNTWAFRCGMAYEVIQKAVEYLEAEKG